MQLILTKNIKTLYFEQNIESEFKHDRLNLSFAKIIHFSLLDIKRFIYYIHNIDSISHDFS